MYPLLNKEIDFHRLPRVRGAEYHMIYDTVAEYGRPTFLHGVSIEEYDGKLVASFAFNAGPENTITETLIVKWSEDGGATWGEGVDIRGKGKDYANSHSVFSVKDGELYLIGPRFNGLGEPPVTKKGHRSIRFLGLQMEAWRYRSGTWESLSIIGGDLWPIGLPEKMDDGNYLIAGCDEYWLAAVAISHGDDFTKFDVVKPDVNDEVYTEAGAWIAGSKVMLVMRNQSTLVDGQYHAAVCLSEDYGRTFGPCEISNLPLTTTKPFCGRLSDGRCYIVFNQSMDGPTNRNRLLLGIGGVSAMSIDRVYELDFWKPEDGKQHGGLSYPYAKEIDGKLYIVYSSTSQGAKLGNENDAKLAIVPLSQLDDE